LVEFHSFLDSQLRNLENLDMVCDIIWMFRMMLRGDHSRKADVIEFVIENESDPVPGFAVLGFTCEVVRPFCTVRYDDADYVVVPSDDPRQFIAFSLPLTIGSPAMLLPRNELQVVSSLRLDETDYTNFVYVLSFMTYDLSNVERMLYSQVLAHFCSFPSFIALIGQNLVSLFGRSICSFKQLPRTAAKLYQMNEAHNKIDDSGFFFPLRRAGVTTYLSPLLVGSTNVTFSLPRGFIGVVSAVRERSQVRHTLIHFPSGKLYPPLTPMFAFNPSQRIIMSVDFSAKTFSVNGITLPFPIGSMFRIAVLMKLGNCFEPRVSHESAFDERQSISFEGPGLDLGQPLKIGHANFEEIPEDFHRLRHLKVTSPGFS
jgi:hypothetical protein